MEIDKMLEERWEARSVTNILLPERVSGGVNVLYKCPIHYFLKHLEYKEMFLREVSDVQRELERVVARIYDRAEEIVAVNLYVFVQNWRFSVVFSAQTDSFSRITGEMMFGDELLNAVKAAADEIIEKVSHHPETSKREKLLDLLATNRRSGKLSPEDEEIIRAVEQMG